MATSEEKIEVQTGKLLLAEPFMLDPNFKRAVVLLCEHQHQQGTVGFILNKPVEMLINDLLSDFPEFQAEVFYGGPVQTDTIHFVHDLGDLLEDSHPVAAGIWWGGNFEQLKFLVRSNLITSRNIRFFVGYSGWSAGQLDDEIKTHSWIIADSDPNYVFNFKGNNLWEEILDQKGDAFSVIAHLPETVILS